MTKIEFADDAIRVDAEALAKAFRIGTEELKHGMRDGTITSRFERGEDEDAGKIRLTFFSTQRRVRMIADEDGNILTCSAADFTRPVAQVRRAEDQATEAGSAYRLHLDALLDTALQDTFPASDPVAINFESPARESSRSGKLDDG